MGRLILITGGARSGKSSFAEKLAGEMARSGTGEGPVAPVVYIATCIPGDDEMRQRVENHKIRRPSHWKTVEEPLDLAGALKREGTGSRVVLVDCLGLYVTNLFCQEAADTPQNDRCHDVLGAVREVAGAARDVPAHVIVVSNEVGMGLVPEYPLGRLFRDALGWANQILAEASDQVYFMVSGIPVAVKP
ncbi:MAG TPA: bifunctional adenosylcobinamide kinase/adenosylcobinamide-phosphate guanylyltransferase [Firmicutes bacterium]|nr:bifunctional adenosylcobinamide kinase/adenosylcobinamide-phosphate guanylyltransferase [Candidatus Fermentithermobacillaceae bacterium]